MIAIRNLSSLFFTALLIAALAGCGDDDDPVASNPGTNPGGTPPPASDVTLEQLEGTWLGTFDDGTLHTFQFDVDNAGAMSNFSLSGVNTSNLSGTITKATETSLAFRFSILSSGSEIARGMMIVDAAAAHMGYLDQHKSFAVLEKGASAVPTYALTDIDASWAGDAFTSTQDFTTLTRTGPTTGECAPTDPATTPPTSQCAVSLGTTSRTVSAVAMDGDQGRFLGQVTDDPPPASAPNAAWRAYMSPDKNFAAVWRCTDFVSGWPQTCDFSTWSRQ